MNKIKLPSIGTRGTHSLSRETPTYHPAISPKMKEVYNIIRKELPFTELSILNTGWFNEFMIHQAFRTYIVIEVEREATLSAFNRLIDCNEKPFLNPGKEIFEYYIPNTENPIIVRSLVTQSPLVEIEDIKTTSLEKLMVDCLCDEDLYGTQHMEASYIYETALEKYAVNLNKLKRYARRRNRISEITSLLLEI